MQLPFTFFIFFLRSFIVAAHLFKLKDAYTAGLNSIWDRKNIPFKACLNDCCCVLASLQLVFFLNHFCFTFYPLDLTDAAAHTSLYSLCCVSLEILTIIKC